MSFHLTSLQLIIGGFSLAFVALLALGAYFDFRRKKTPPFLNYLYSDFDEVKFNQELSRQGSFLEPDEWHVRNQARVVSQEVSETTTQNRL